jgi:hypothetical protein
MKARMGLLKVEGVWAMDDAYNKCWHVKWSENASLKERERERERK